MSVKCQGLVARDQCNAVHTSRYTSGRVGYTGAPIPQAIVLHKLVGISAEAYNNQITSPLPKFQCAIPTPSLCQEFPASQNPKSVHFLVTDTGIWQYAELSTTTFGIDYLLGSTWPGLAALLPITDPNGPFIHIAVDSCSADTLIRLLCCIGTELERSLPIITAHDLQIDREEFLLNPGIQTQVDICVASGGFVEQPSLPDIVRNIEELQQCCFDNRSDIVVLQQDVVSINQRLYALEQWRIQATAQIDGLVSLTSVIPTLVDQITVLINQVINIQNNCCPDTSTATNCFRYQLLPGDEMLITPNQPVWLNLPSKLEDRDNPNCVTGCCGTIANQHLEIVKTVLMHLHCPPVSSHRIHQVSVIPLLYRNVQRSRCEQCNCDLIRASNFLCTQNTLVCNLVVVNQIWGYCITIMVDDMSSRQWATQ